MKFILELCNFLNFFLILKRPKWIQLRQESQIIDIIFKLTDLEKIDLNVIGKVISTIDMQVYKWHIPKIGKVIPKEVIKKEI